MITVTLADQTLITARAALRARISGSERLLVDLQLKPDHEARLSTQLDRWRDAYADLCRAQMEAVIPIHDDLDVPTLCRRQAG